MSRAVRVTAAALLLAVVVLVAGAVWAVPARAAVPADPASIAPVHADAISNCQSSGGITWLWNLSCAAAAIEGGANAVVGAAEGALSTWITSSAGVITGALLTSVGSPHTDPTFGDSAWSRIYLGGNGGVGALTIALWLALPILLAAVVYHLLSGDVGGMLRTVFVRLPMAGVVSFAAIAWVTVLMSITDWLTQEVIQTDGLTGLDQWLAQLTPTNLDQSFIVVVVCLVIIAATLLAYIELIVRAATLYLLVAFIPIVAAASIWPGGRSGLKKLAEVVVVTVASKFVMAFVLVIGASLLISGDSGDYLRLIEGAVLLLMAATMPLGVFRMVPLLEGAAAGAFVGWGAARAPRMASRAGHRLSATANGTSARVRQMLGVDRPSPRPPSAAAPSRLVPPGSGTGGGLRFADRTAPGEGTASETTPHGAAGATPPASTASAPARPALRSAPPQPLDVAPAAGLRSAGGDEE